MRPNEIEYRQLKEMDERMRRFKEAEWDRLGHGDPRGMLLECIIFSLPFIGPVLLLLNLLYEWSSKFSRMCWIAVKAFYFYSIIAIKKSIDKLETKLFELWKKMI